MYAFAYPQLTLDFLRTLKHTIVLHARGKSDRIIFQPMNIQFELLMHGFFF
jgi:hypothetical protein